MEPLKAFHLRRYEFGGEKIPPQFRWPWMSRGWNVGIYLKTSQSMDSCANYYSTYSRRVVTLNCALRRIREVSPKSPKHSGLGIILICPDGWLMFSMAGAKWGETSLFGIHGTCKFFKDPWLHDG